MNVTENARRFLLLDENENTNGGNVDITGVSPWLLKVTGTESEVTGRLPIGWRKLGPMVRLTSMLQVVLYILHILGYFIFHSSFLPLSLYTVVPCIWQLWTCHMVQQHLLVLIVAILSQIHAGRYLECFWSSRTYGLFLITVMAASSSVVVLVMLVKAVATFSFTVPTVHGAWALMGAYLVAFKQLTPEHRIWTMKADYAPSIYILLLIFMYLLSFATLYELVLGIAGVASSWVYLRFFQRVGGDEGRGDRSEALAFASFFPSAIQPFARQLSRVTLRLLIMLRLCSSVESAAAADMEQGAARKQRMLATQAGVALPDADRRRQLALKALDARMASKVQQNSKTLESSLSTTPT